MFVYVVVVDVNMIYFKLTDLMPFTLETLTTDPEKSNISVATCI